jgi:hypothetical protein
VDLSVVVEEEVAEDHLVREVREVRIDALVLRL